MNEDTNGSTAETSSRDWLVDTFIDHSTWLAPYLSNPSRMGVFQWLVEHLTSDAVKELESILRLDSRVQQKAEEQLIDFFEQNSRPKIRRRVKRRSRQISRRTDWGRTMGRAVHNPPTVYWEDRRIKVPDVQLMQALVSTARSWSSVLRKAEKFERANNLTSSYEHLPNRWKKPAPLGRRELKRLRRFDPQLAKVIEAALHYWRQQLDDRNSEDFRQLLLKLVDGADAFDQSSDRNVLMELTVTVAIARAVTEGEGPTDSFGDRCWQLERLLLEQDDVPPVRLRSGELCCEISKKKPDNQLRVDGLDRNVDILNEIGVSADGYEPDIVLQFWLEKQTDQFIFAFADAKRNQSDDGQGYIRTSLKDTATAYLVAFAHLMGEPSESVPPHRIGTAVNPAVTIFAYQGVDKVAGIPCREHDNTRILSCLRNSERLPWLVAFDRQHLGARTDDTWQSPFLSAWFNRLARQAHRALRDGRGYHVGQIVS